MVCSRPDGESIVSRRRSSSRDFLSMVPSGPGEAGGGTGLTSPRRPGWRSLPLLLRLVLVLVPVLVLVHVLLVAVLVLLVLVLVVLVLVVLVLLGHGSV